MKRILTLLLPGLLAPALLLISLPLIGGCAKEAGSCGRQQPDR